MRALHVTQTRDRVSNSGCELFDGFDPATRSVVQIGSQQQLGLADDSGQRVIDLVPNMSDQIGNFRQFLFVFCDNRSQLVFAGFAFLGRRSIGAHSVTFLSQRDSNSSVDRWCRAFNLWERVEPLRSLCVEQMPASKLNLSLPRQSRVFVVLVRFESLLYRLMKPNTTNYEIHQTSKAKSRKQWAGPLKRVRIAMNSPKNAEFDNRSTDT
jgi:hypothetical protein